MIEAGYAQQTSGHKFNWEALVSTLNLILIIVGYPVAASLLVFIGNNSADSQIITIPYRFLHLLLSILSIYVGISGVRGHPKISRTMVLFLVLFGLLILRVFFDLLVDRTGFAQMMSFKVWGLIISSFFAALSVFFSYRYINFDATIIISIILSIFVTILKPLGIGSGIEDMLFDTSMQRQVGSGALFSIAYGYVGVNAVLMSLFVLFSKRFNILVKILPLIAIPLGVLAVFQSGSRSPFITLVVVLLICFATTLKNYFLDFLAVAISVLSLWIFKSQVLEVMANIAPILSSRLRAMIEEDQLSGRDYLAVAGFTEAVNSPILGSTTINTTTYVTTITGYHSAIIDALAYLGFIGGFAVIALFAYTTYYAINILHRRNFIPHYWVASLLVGYMFFAVTASGLFHINEAFASFIVLTIVTCKESDSYQLGV